MIKKNIQINKKNISNLIIYKSNKHLYIQIFNKYYQKNNFLISSNNKYYKKIFKFINNINKIEISKIMSKIILKLPIKNINIINKHHYKFHGVNQKIIKTLFKR